MDGQTEQGTLGTPRELTFGEKLMGVNFNPSNLSNVYSVKRSFAYIADTIGDPTADTEKRSWTYNVLRTAALNGCVLAQMSVVKFITWKD